MEKALRFLKHMKQTDTPYNFRECELDEAIAEIEEAIKPKSCDGCKYQIHKVDDVQQNGNWLKYSVFYDCGHDNNCKRNTADRYEPKEMI